jgi:5'-methylthioadenosine phosphorylase
MSEPFCPSLRAAFLKSGEDLGFVLRSGGVYTCIPGPQFETLAEAEMLRRLGGNIAGMTVVPEAKLAREAGMCYQPAALVVNRAGETGPAITHQNTLDVMARQLPSVSALLARCAVTAENRDECSCATVPAAFRG